MSYQLYRNTTLGHTLQEALDELMQMQMLSPALAIQVLHQVMLCSFLSLHNQFQFQLTFFLITCGPRHLHGFNSCKIIFHELNGYHFSHASFRRLKFANDKSILNQWGIWSFWNVPDQCRYNGNWFIFNFSLTNPSTTPFPLESRSKSVSRQRSWTRTGSATTSGRSCSTTSSFATATSWKKSIVWRSSRATLRLLWLLLKLTTIEKDISRVIKTISEFKHFIL